MSETRIRKGVQKVGDVEVETSIVIPTPELDKMLAVKEKSQIIGEFIENGGYTLCKWNDRFVPGRYTPVSKPIEQILAEYFGIDLNKVEKERRALLEGIRR